MENSLLSPKPILPAVDVKLETSWKNQLAAEFTQAYFHKLIAAVKQELAAGKTIYPAGPHIFEAFAKTPFDKVKVVILGQDPYHNPGEAMGLSFSVPQGVTIPPSLLNIYKELSTDLGIDQASHGDLSLWAEQGVFLLNTILTVQRNSPKSHHKFGWDTFTDAVIRTLSDRREHLVFLLWGKSAQAKAELIDVQKHLVLAAAHPSPLARGAFFGSRPFSQTNAYLKKHGNSAIDWRL